MKTVRVLILFVLCVCLTPSVYADVNNYNSPPNPDMLETWYTLGKCSDPVIQKTDGIDEAKTICTNPDETSEIKKVEVILRLASFIKFEVFVHKYSYTINDSQHVFTCDKEKNCKEVTTLTKVTTNSE